MLCLLCWNHTRRNETTGGDIQSEEVLKVQGLELRRLGFRIKVEILGKASKKYSWPNSYNWGFIYVNMHMIIYII